jgi:hypothetical protein
MRQSPLRSRLQMTGAVAAVGALLWLGCDGGALAASTSTATTATTPTMLGTLETTAAEPSAASTAGELPAAQSQCSGSSTCIWYGFGYSGTEAQWTNGTVPYDAWSARNSAQAGSLYNNRATWVSWIASTTNYQALGGYEACLPVGYDNPNITEYGYPPSYSVGALNNIRGVLLSGSRTTCP